ncbi:MAG: hypothetical protein LBH05_06605 [Deferribacteraceae bacterium]|jgi:hypothetical protein|nr:hypothetical protein [Deferribacteraceae bacterium]
MKKLVMFVLFGVLALSLYGCNSASASESEPDIPSNDPAVQQLQQKIASLETRLSVLESNPGGGGKVSAFIYISWHDLLNTSIQASDDESTLYLAELGNSSKSSAVTLRCEADTVSNNTILRFFLNNPSSFPYDDDLVAFALIPSLAYSEDIKTKVIKELARNGKWADKEWDIRKSDPYYSIPVSID